jgi:hypothetical protein
MNVAEKVSHESIAQLLSAPIKGSKVTIYVPTHKSAAPPHMSEDQIRFKNLMNKAIEQLQGKDDELIKTLQAKLEECLKDQHFWESQTEGLLLCAERDELYLFHLPLDCEEYVAVDAHYHLAPILGLLSDEQKFYVLIVAQHEPALYMGDMYGLYPTELKLPASVEEGLNIDEMTVKSEHARSAGAPSFNPSAFNGRGGAKNSAEEERMRFWRTIDHMLHEKTDRSLPLILAGIEAETVEYRHISKYPKIMHGTIPGSFNQAAHGERELYEKAQVIIYTEIINKHHQEAVERFERVKGANPQKIAMDSEAAVAAERGQIDTLLIGMSRFTTDTIRDNAEPVREIAFTRHDDMNHFVNNVALQAGATSSQIVNVLQEDMPGGAPLLAILRY